MKKERNITINSDAYAYLKALLDPRIRILDAYVWGKWLKAELSSGITFSVKNKAMY